MKNTFLLIIFLSLLGNINAQIKPWTLKDCLTYAEKNNIQIKQANLLIDQAKVNKNTSTMAYLPTIRSSASVSWNNGLTQNFTTGVLENQTNFGGNGSIGSNVNLFSGFQNRYNYKKSLLEIISAQYQYKDVIKNIQTQIASAYVQILLAKENLSNTKYQLENSIKQKERIKELIDAGVSPKGDLTDAEAQITNDNLQVIQAENAYQLAKLSLAQLLELKNPNDFEIKENESDLQIDESLLLAKPENLVSKAEKVNYKLKNAEIKKQISTYQTKLAKASLLPSLSGFVNVNSRYSDRKNIGFGGITTPADPLWEQVKNNRGLTYGFSLNIPILNGFRMRNNVKLSKINEQRTVFEYENNRKQLRNDIYKMQLDVKSAFQSLKAAEANLKAQQKAYDYATEKFKVGVMNIFDLNNVKVKYQRAENQYINAKYQYYLKSKLLEFNVSNY